VLTVLQVFLHSHLCKHSAWRKQLSMSSWFHRRYTLPVTGSGGEEGSGTKSTQGQCEARSQKGLAGGGVLWEGGSKTYQPEVWVSAVSGLGPLQPRAAIVRGCHSERHRVPQGPGGFRYGNDRD